MKRLAILGYLVAVLLAVFPLGAALAQTAPSVAAPPGPTTRFLTRFDVTTAPERFDQVMLVTDFAPGAWAPSHTHGGYLYITVVEGEITARTTGRPATEKKYKAGETFVEVPGEFLEVGNAGAAKVRLFSTGILPKGAALTTVEGQTSTQNLPPGATTVYRTSVEVTRPAGPFEVVQFLLDFAPGTWTPPHTHGGQGLVTVIAGEATLRRAGADRVYRAGEFWAEAGDAVHAAGNASGGVTQVGVGFLLPKGATLTTVQPAAPPAAPVQVPRQLPRTGGAGAPLLALGAGGFACAAAAWLLRRRGAR